MSGQTAFSVIIPCYRSEKYLKKTAEELFRTMKMHPDLRMHLILVNDCSPDNTFGVIRELCAAYPAEVTGVDLAENAGQALAKMAGLAFAKDGPVVFMDDDGQHDPQAIPKLLGAVKGADLVYARFPEPKESLFRRAGSRALDLLLTLVIRKPAKLRITSYFALSPRAVRALRTYRSRHPFIGGYLMSKGFSAASVPVSHRGRESGRSGYTLAKLIRRAAELMLLFRFQLPKGSPDPYVIKEVIGRT